jgi:PPK2 family polyphosphate:nucleotide phosphotransferase
MKQLGKLARAYCVERGKHFKLKDFDPADTADIRSKERATAALQKSLEQLADLQNRLYAQDQWAVLLIFQGMDASGKDGVIKHVMTGVNPMGCQAYSFKAPSSEEQQHDYLWRTMQRIPERRRIGIFNRSYYEEVLIVRVHPDLLHNENIPPSLITKKIWEERFDDMCAFERYLTRNGIVVLKFFLNLSKKEQAKRFLARLDEPQ